MRGIKEERKGKRKYFSFAQREAPPLMTSFQNPNILIILNITINTSEAHHRYNSKIGIILNFYSPP